MAITRIGNPAIADVRGVNFRNIIINGGMDLAQRGTSFTGITSGSNYCLDRFTTVPVSAGTWTQSQSTDVPTGQGFAKSAKLDCTTANGSLSANSLLYFQQRVEGQNLQYLKKGTSSAESVTMSFWVKSNKTGTYIVELFDNDNTRQISKSYTINSANTWEKKTLTYAGDTTGAFDNDNALSLYCFFWLAGGTDYTSGTLSTTWTASTNANRAVGQVNLADSTNNEWYITGVQLEAGSQASDFEFLPFEINENMCFRYYQSYEEQLSIIRGYGYNNNAGLDQIYSLTKSMRSPPTVTLSSTSDGGSSTGMVVSKITKKKVNFNLDPTNSSQTIYYSFKFVTEAEL